MLYDYGLELDNVLNSVPDDERREAALLRSFGLLISSVFRGLSPTSRKILYFPPGRYVLSRTGVAAETFTCPKGVELFFANEAILRVGPGVTLVIEGTIRAGIQQIFGFNREEVPFLYRNGRTAFPTPPEMTTWPIGDVTELDGRRVPCGRVVIVSDNVPLVRPEWWGSLTWDQEGRGGASPTFPLAGYDCKEAFLGAIDAACLGRVGRAPIPIVMTGLYQFGRAVEVRCPVHDGRLMPVSLVMRGSAGLSGFPSMIRMPGTPGEDRLPEVLLRIHPGVDFDFQDLHLKAADEVEGVLDVICSPDDPPGRRGCLRRVTIGGGLEYQMRVTEFGRSTARRQFVIDGCYFVPVPSIAVRNGIRMDVGPGVMLRLSNSGMGSSDFVETLEITDQARFLAICHLTGGSALLDSLLFHQALGPRPSRDDDLGRPDGQDIFVGAPTVKDRPATQLTVLQCESQGWWMLGRDPAVSYAHQTVLIGCSHTTVVWHLPANVRRRNAWAAPYGVAAIRENAGAGLGIPPSVVWLGSTGQCVFIGCRFRDSVVLNDPSSIVDVATVFKRGDGTDLRRTFLAPARVPRRATGYAPLTDVPPSDTYFDNDRRLPHLVPILES